MRDDAGSDGTTERPAARILRLDLFAVAAVCGGVVGMAGTASLFLFGIGPLAGTGWVALAAYALTTLSLGGLYVLVGRARPKLGMAALLAAFASLLVVVCFFVYWRFATSEGSRFLAVGYWTAYAARPLVVLLFGGVAVAVGERTAKQLGGLLVALGVLGTTPLVMYAVLPSWYSSSVFGWPGLLLGVPWIGTGLLETAGWVLLGGGILRCGRELRAREIEEQNLRKALRLYREAFGEGDLSVIGDLLAGDFFDHLHDRRGPENFRHTVSSLRETFPDLEVSIEEQTAEGQTVTTRLSLQGTDRGGVLWYPATGRRATFAAAYEDCFSGGKLVEHGGEVDMAGLLGQLGLPHRDGRAIEERDANGER